MSIEGPVGRAAWTIHVVADSDTRWKWGAGLAERMAHESAPRSLIEGHLLQGRATPNDRQLADVGASTDAVRRVGIAQLLRDLATTDADVVVLACVGGTIQSLLHGLARVWAERSRRPVVVTGYVGVVYERLVDGLLLRAGADVVLANSHADVTRFAEVFHAVGVDPATVVGTALPFLEGGAQPQPRRAGPFTVTFVAQPSVPEKLEERRYAMEQVLRHAALHPERHVVVKLRGRVGEQTTHVENFHYTDLLPAVLPRNVEVAYGSMSDVLDRTDLCVTVSSTAALESMQRDIPTAILTDFGVREVLGNHWFLASGALTSWRALHDGEVPKFDPDWAADNGVGDPDPCGRVQARIERLIADRGQLPPLRPWFDARDAGGYLPAVLERNGLGPDGAPLAGAAWGLADPGLARRYARATARALYQVSVRRLEPRIRRWAQL